MPEHPRADEPAPEPFEELRRDAPVFAVAPIRARTRLPGIALVAIAVAVAAFVAGIGVASAGPTPRPGASTAPAIGGAARGPGASDPLGPSSSSGAATGSPGAAESPAPGGAGPDAAGPTPSSDQLVAGSSAFVASFRPDAILVLATAGEGCTTGEPRDKEVPRSRRDGPRLTFQRSWLAWCPIPEARRQAFLVDVFEALVRLVPADTYGYTAGEGGGGDALFPYAEPPLAGTVAVAADAAGTGFVVAIVLEEWRSDQVR